MRVFLILALVLTSCTKQETKLPSPPLTKEELRVVIPDEIERYDYFKTIDAFAQENGLPKLRETILPENDLEIRVLAGFGLFGVDGFVLKRAAGEWSAWHLRRMICHYGNYGKVNLPSPKSGWEKAWQRLVEAGILRLSGVHHAGINDGTSYIVETNLNKTYLIYEFENPNFLKDKDSQRMVKIGEILAEEFGLETFKVGYICR